MTAAARGDDPAYRRAVTPIATPTTTTTVHVTDTAGPAGHPGPETTVRKGRTAP